MRSVYKRYTRKITWNWSFLTWLTKTQHCCGVTCKIRNSTQQCHFFNFTIFMNPYHDINHTSIHDMYFITITWYHASPICTNYESQLLQIQEFITFTGAYNTPVFVIIASKCNNSIDLEDSWYQWYQDCDSALLGGIFDDIDTTQHCCGVCYISTQSM